MTRRSCATAGCDGKTRDVGIICDGCVRDLERALGDVAALTTGRHLAAELVIATIGLDRLEQTGGRSGITSDERQPWCGRCDEQTRTVTGETPDGPQSRRCQCAIWPQTSALTAPTFDAAAAEAAWVLANTLWTWARIVIDVQQTLTCPATARASIVAHWMLTQLDEIRLFTAGDELVDEILAAVRNAEHAIDRDAERLFVGPCDRCELDLYAMPDAAEVTCRQCAATYDVAARRGWLLAECEDRLAYAEQVARFVTCYGQPITASMVRNYAARGSLLAKSVDHAGRPLYRVGDVIDEHQRVLAAKAEKQAKTARRHAQTAAVA